MLAVWFFFRRQFFFFKMTTKRPKVCVIGAGPCGMSALFHFGQMGNQAPEVVCYEKGNTWLGLWNFTWMTGMCT